MNTEHKLPDGFGSPTALPNEQKQTEWQQSNRAWWESNPMRYDWNEQIQLPEFSREFYQEIDKRFFYDSSRYMPPKKRPFDEIVPFDQLPQWDVLEIGVGSGSHGQLMAPHCKSYTGIDLTEYAAANTRRRFEVFSLKGDIRQMDAEQMQFADNSFDFIWTWGVIHHSANTGRILAEMKRVLRPGGRAAIMVYHRSFLYLYIVTALCRGVLCGGFVKTRSLHGLVQCHTDGAIARFYRPSEWRTLIDSNGFVLEGELIKGQKSEVLPLPAGRFKDFLMKVAPNAPARFITNTCRQGSFLITLIRKP
jgi:SAM-dependent methyltransferase